MMQRRSGKYFIWTNTRKYSIIYFYLKMELLHFVQSANVCMVMNVCSRYERSAHSQICLWMWHFCITYICVSDDVQCFACGVWLLGGVHTGHGLDAFASYSLSLPLQVFLDGAQFLLLCVRVLGVHIVGSLRFFHRMYGVLCWRRLLLGDGSRCLHCDGHCQATVIRR